MNFKRHSKGLSLGKRCSALLNSLLNFFLKYLSLITNLCPSLLKDSEFLFSWDTARLSLSCFNLTSLYVQN